MPFVVFLYMHMHVENLCILLPKNYIEIDILQIRGHDPEAADLTIYLAITVSTFYFFAYIYIYIQGGLWHYVDRKNFYMGNMVTRRLRRHFPVPLIFLSQSVDVSQS